MQLSVPDVEQPSNATLRHSSTTHYEHWRSLGATLRSAGTLCAQ
jgi:hypothetical protein